MSTEWKSAITGSLLCSFEECPAAVVKGWVAASKAIKDACEPDH